MSVGRWRRFLPSQSKVALIFGLLLLVWASLAFVDLVTARNQALTKHRQMVQRIGVAQAQGDMLRRALDGARAGQNIIPKAYQYFGLTPEDVTLIVPQVAPESEAASAQRWESVDPWAEIAEWLDQTLTNLLDRVQ